MGQRRGYSPPPPSPLPCIRPWGAHLREKSCIRSKNGVNLGQFLLRNLMLSFVFREMFKKSHTNHK